jgi:hypothetical protein
MILFEGKREYGLHGWGHKIYHSNYSTNWRSRIGTGVGESDKS